VVEAGLTLGSKAIGCFGGCDFHGIPHNVYWTHLSQTTNVGDSTIYLEDEVDWQVNDEIIITTTGYRAVETERRVITAVSGNEITLNSPLAYRHLGEEYTVEHHQYSIKSEVALLTRNIKIIGEQYDDQDTHAFGARVLVGSISSADVIGWARFENVEFVRPGQEGFTEASDPRFGLAFLNTGTSTSDRPSYVNGCAFVDGYSTAIGTFGANGVNITHNVVYRTIHDGIKITGNGHRMEHNLVASSLFRGSWLDRNQVDNYFDWHASFHIVGATNLVMNHNTAAGSERVGFKIGGETCTDDSVEGHTGNTAHGVLQGVHILYDTTFDCSLVRNYLIYKAFDYGVYIQADTGIILRNNKIIDATAGFLAIHNGGVSLEHTFSDKITKIENHLCVGRSDSFDQTLDIVDSSDKNIQISGSHRAPRTATGGMSCFIIPLFQSGPNMAPEKPWQASKKYGAIRGLFDIDGLVAHNYKLNSNGQRDLVFWTNPMNEDVNHPTHVKNSILSEVEKNSVVQFERPLLSNVRQGECVDMECDGKKTIFIKDIDGSLLGAPGAILPDAAFAWDNPNELGRGLGDYRIPKSLLTDPSNGNSIEVETISDYRGVLGNRDCDYIDSWHAFDCHHSDVYDYRMLSVESMDEDTEFRRLSPVAVLGDRSLNLLNGMTDHTNGWGQRLSLFHPTVALNTHFDIHFTGTTPKNLRMHLLNVNATDSMRVAIYYSNSERLDVYNGADYIRPLDSVQDADGNWITQSPPEDNPQLYHPSMSGSHGDNYFDRTNQLLYITLRGSEPIDVVTTPAIFIAVGFPSVSVDDFFQVNLVSNLAAYLGVEPYQIKVVNVVRESSSRRKRSTRSRRSTDVTTFTIQLDSDIVDSSTTSASDTAGIVNILNSKATKILADYQNNVLWELLNVTDGVAFASSTASSSSVATDSGETLISHLIPSALVVNTTVNEEEYLPFTSHPVIHLVDSQGAAVTTLGDTWTVGVTFTPDSNTSSASLIGTTTVAFSNGTAEFTDLKIDRAGIHQLTFQILSPTSVSVSSATISVNITQRVVDFAITSAATLLPHGSNVDLALELRNSVGGVLENMGYQGHSYSATVSLDSTASTTGNPTLGGTTSTSFSSTSASVSGLTMANTLDYHKYNLIVNVVTTPALHNIVQYHTIQFYDPTSSLHTASAVGSVIKLTFAGTVNRAAVTTRSTASTSTDSFDTYVYNYLTDLVNGTAFVGSLVVDTVGSNTEITAPINAVDTATLNSALDYVSNALRTSNAVLTHNGQAYYNADSNCVVEIDGSCTSVSSTSAESSSVTLETWVIIVIALTVSIVMGLMIIGITCYLKRENSYLIRKKKNVLGCAAGVGSQSTIGTNLLRFSPSQSPDLKSNIGDSSVVISVMSRPTSEHGFTGYRTVPSRKGSPTSLASSDTLQNLPRVEN